MASRGLIMKVKALVVAVVLLMASAWPAHALLQTLMLGWERYFKIEWQSEGAGHPGVYGKIFNDGGFSAKNVRLLTEGVDAQGNVQEQKITWLGFELTPGTTAPFEVSLSQPASSYRVAVFAYDWVQRGKGIR